MSGTNKRYRPTLSQIQKSLEEGQNMQAVDQIKQYGIGDFFVDYQKMMSELPPDSGWDASKMYSRATVLYMENRRVKR